MQPSRMAIMIKAFSHRCILIALQALGQHTNEDGERKRGKKKERRRERKEKERKK